ncbi:B-box zinc finger protein 19-like isoform X2 [Magnolia sinica]|uniref:B-box zinc finger protein 19-like isoform X2 n=1 Tax=Magnolia sinica TaxID=86752 RepID=UPI0026584CE6|nr:B-box zinc finger protein 19-like isoform X2 [Magnolia sinica]
MIDLNSRPNQIHGQPSNTQGMNALNDSNHECASVVPVGSCNQDLEKYEESFPVSVEVLDSSFCLPIGKAKGLEA